MRLYRLRWAEWLIGAGGALLLASMVALPWYHARQPGHVPASGWQAYSYRSLTGWQALTHLRWVFAVCVAVALGTWLLQATLRAPAIPVAATLLTAVLGGVTTILLIYRVLADPPAGTRKVGGFVALVAALALTYGGWRSLRIEGIAKRDAPAEIPTVDPLAGAHS